MGHKADIVMRGTLHQLAPNTYYGQWPRVFAGEAARFCRSIAHNERRAQRLIHRVWRTGAQRMRLAPLFAVHGMVAMALFAPAPAGGDMRRVWTLIFL